MSSPHSILVVGPSWVGDMVMAQSLFIALKQQTPDCLIDVLAPAWSLPLLARMPQVRQGIAMPLGHGQFGLSARFRLGRQLQGRYDQAIVLPNSWKSALVPFFAGIPLRTGYLGELRWGLLNDARRLDKKRLTMTVQRFVALGLAGDAKLPPDCPIPQLAIGTEQRQQAREKFSIDAVKKILALCPGAEYGPAKRWPAEHFAAVANAKIGEGWQVWLFGSDKDRPVADAIVELTGGVCRNFVGETTLAEAVDLLALADAVVSNDSGLMHVAAALDKKIVAVYGSSDPGFTPPLNPAAQILSLKLACSPCFKRNCPFGHTRCLTELGPAQVLAALEADR
ncbi:lipopolysaccharide heptosyltransferase II [Methylomonas koyamae]|nr:lipopolysaccharide heptosyltransferase II [Methylomonas koyamae]WNB74996.1 lipopolysaccharide heptosyltransferase II [Methylomonas koyamae]